MSLSLRQAMSSLGHLVLPRDFKIRARSLLSIILMLGFSIPSNAEEPVRATGENLWYGGIGWLSFNSDQIPERDLEARHNSFFSSRAIGGRSFGQRRIDFDDSESGYRVFIGVSPNESWDWELGFVSFNDVEGTFTAGQIDAPFTSSVLTSTGSLQGLYWHVQYRFDLSEATFINGLELVPRLGLWGWDEQISSVYQTDSPTLGTRTLVENNRGWDEYYGIGLSYEITSGFHLRFDVERYTFDSAELDLASVSIDFIVPRIPYLFW